MAAREWGIFADGALIEDGFYAAAKASARVGELHNADVLAGNADVPASYYSVVELCQEHEGQPKDGCEICDAEPEDEAPVPKPTSRRGRSHRGCHGG